MSKVFQYKLLLILAAAVLFLDQASKYWVSATLPYGAFFPPQSIEVIPGFFNIVHVGNTGAAWSLFSDYTWALTLVGFAALILIFVFREALELRETRIQFSFGLIIGGIIGNLIDRVQLGHVVDFLDFHYKDYHFPSFNVADSGITVGVAFYIFYSFKSHGTQPPVAEADKGSIPRPDQPEPKPTADQQPVRESSPKSADDSVPKS